MFSCKLNSVQFATGQSKLLTADCSLQTSFPTSSPLCAMRSHGWYVPIRRAHKHARLLALPNSLCGKRICLRYIPSRHQSILHHNMALPALHKQVQQAGRLRNKCLHMLKGIKNHLKRPLPLILIMSSLVYDLFIEH